MPIDVWKDHKKLSKFLYEVHEAVNKILSACQQQTRLVANELVARPTYAEEFENIRSNIHTVVRKKQDGTFSGVGGSNTERIDQIQSGAI